MNKLAIVKTLQVFFLVLILSSIAAASAMNNSQYSLSSSLASSSSNMSSSIFKTTAALESIAGLSNSSAFSAALGIQSTIPTCNNNIVELGEVCDGISLEGETCTSRGFTSGTLACSNDCLSFDTSSCITSKPQQQGGAAGEIIGKSAEETTTTTSSTTTTTTTLQLPEKETPSIIAETAIRFIEKTTAVLKNIREKSKAIYFIILTLATLLAAYAIYLSIILISRKLKQNYKEYQKQRLLSKNLQESSRERIAMLKQYLKENMENYTLYQLSAALIQNNWPKEEIQEAIKEILEELRK